MRIFLTGFQRSGTTLLRHIFRMHPNIKKMYHEECILPKKREDLSNKIKFDFEKENWGEKLPWYDMKRSGFKGDTLLDYCDRWIDYFAPDVRIIQIVRHPYDVIISNQKTFGVKPRNCLEQMNRLIPKVIPKISKLEYSMSISFEDLLLETDITLKNMFEFCGIDNSPEIIEYIGKTKDKKNIRMGGIKKKRAYAYSN